MRISLFHQALHSFVFWFNFSTYESVLTEERQEVKEG